MAPSGGSVRPGAEAAVADHLGRRLRARRTAAGIGLRELSRRVGVSAGLVSQIETGKVRPSVSTLYAIATELGASIDSLLFGDDGAPPPPGSSRDSLSDPLALLRALPRVTGVQRASDRKRIQLNKGVRWERLTPTSVPGIDFLYVVYEPGAESSPPDAFQRHVGREWAYLVSGTLFVSVGFEEYELHAGDSVTYDSSTPHRLHNPGSEPAEAVWFLIG